MAGTPRGRRVGQRLREARIAAGYDSIPPFAAKIGRDRSTVSRWETGERQPSPDDVTRYLMTLNASMDEVDDVQSLLVGDNGNEVWLSRGGSDRVQQMAALLEAEDAARTITHVGAEVVPGVLQTKEYARAIMESGGLPAEEVRSRVLERLGRRDMLTRRTNPVHLVAVIDEVVLRRRVGGHHVMLEQLQHLSDQVKLETVTFRVVPIASDWNPVQAGQFTLIDPVEGSSIKPVVQQEVHHTTLFFDNEEDVAAYRIAVDTAESVAMSASDSEALIADIINELETGG
ncbi:helix-turn-helix domain-containing protein [Amycolatopsis sp. CA-230715]|uniref:helix-turn-helix domain-containing protein n=1 Tax=Amycolatopsis sp. CA-230715 TaxID=2745196 RepID=UPI001C0309E7|nr:helix-turn-helix transcriptional regulator [Amycolatopsis sp. CA-230715]